MVVKSKDTVVVISGKDKGKQGQVISVRPAEGKVTVEGVAMVKKHRKLCSSFLFIQYLGKEPPRGECSSEGLYRDKEGYR